MSIELYFLRHAVAVERGAERYSDAERPLTEEGRRKMIREIRGMKALGLGFEALLSSPLRRAEQTAELVRRHLPFDGRVELVEQLEPAAPLRALLKLLGSRREKSFLLVGHEPTLSTWVQALLACGRSATVELKKGALCGLSLERAEEGTAAQLTVLLPPKALRRMG